MDRPVTPEAILHLGMAFWGSKTLLSAVDLGVFTELAKGPQNADSLAKSLELHPRGANDFFDALVALKMLDLNEGVYTNTPETEQFLDKAKQSYIGGILAMANARLYPSWGNLTEALRTGDPQSDQSHGGFEALYADPDRLRLFLSAMTGVSQGSARAMAHKFPWEKYKSFVDIGCAQGALPVQIALKHEHLTGGGFDLPVVGPIFTDYVASFGLTDRLRFYPGDFTRDDLPPADVYVMGHILHDWDLGEKRRLVELAYRSLPPGGAFIVHEAIIDNERRENAFGLLMSLNMLVQTAGGFDFTGSDCCGWMKEAGFRETHVEPLAGPDSMVVAIK